MSHTSNNSDITIVGGGFAGLAAALRLHRAGVKIRILEKRPFFGGRAYSFLEPKTGQVVDNGQHLMMGAYQETFQFLRELGTFSQLEFQKGLKVSFAQDAERFFTLKCPNLPAPFHLGFGLMRFKGLGFNDKRKMMKLVRFCQKVADNGAELDQLTVAELLKKTGQTERATQVFWEPIGLATLNEPLGLANAKLFVEVLRQGLLSKKAHSNLVIPKCGFSELYANPAREYFEKEGIPLSFQTQVSGIEKRNGIWEIITSQGERLMSEAILFAIPPNQLRKILEISDLKFLNSLPQLDRFQPSPIVSINLWFEGFDPEQDFIGLTHSPIHWIFNKAKVYAGKRGHYLSLVVSGAYDLVERDKEELVELAKKEISKIFPITRSKQLLHSQVIKEREATFGGRANTESYRPTPHSFYPGLFIAGDWTATGLPATIESAVKSGHMAAQSYLENRG